MLKRLCASEKCEESLYDHLLNVGECCEFLVRELNIDLNSQLGLLAGILHDVGKGIKLYQEFYNVIGSFVGHEYFSALFAKYVVDSIGLKDHEKFIVLYSILMHHQASGSFYDRLDHLMDKLKNMKNNVEVLYFEETIRDVLSKLLSSICSSREIEESLAKYSKTVTNILRELYVIKSPIIYVFNINLFDIPIYARHLARSLCGIVMVCDKYVASKARGGKENPYFTSIRDMLKGLGYIA